MRALCIPLTWRYLLAFYCLGALMGMSHALAHHAAGFAICGDWGYKTFNFFVLAEGCNQAHPEGYWLATLVFSTVPALRIFSAFVGGDETWMVHHVWGNDPRALWIMKACVLIGIVREGLIIKQHVLADTLARSRNAARSSASFAKRCRITSFTSSAMLA